MSMKENLFRPAVFNLTDYVAGKTIEEVKRELGLTDIIKLASNENPFGFSPRVRKAIMDELSNLAMYPEKSFIDLKKILADANGVRPENIVVGHGSEAIIQIIPLLFIDPGDEVILPEKTFGRYEEVCKLMNAKIKKVPLTNYKLDLELMSQAVTEATKLIWVCNPNNPTGTIVKKTEVERFLERLPEGIAVVFDQAYLEYVDDEEYADGLDFLKKGYENVIVLRTFSKAHGLAGLRLGYAIASSRICQLLDRIKEPFNLNRFSIVAGPASLADKEWLDECIRQNRLGRAFLTEQLTKLGCKVVPSQANFVLVDVKHDAETVFEKLMARGVIIRPATAWGYKTYIRVTVGTQEQNERFIRALAEVLLAT